MILVHFSPTWLVWLSSTFPYLHIRRGRKVPK
jgi:hypothetical protein